ncbi:sulfate ABC transporter substrate-binding protein [Methylopila turkensis]|uniref:Sulfate transporter subunit n=1 Tax=Methylopila turkensis TaxID=1437816 RepID=A0A9W6N841_9HYPH|nr:sulfate ABC transporter substrate-binding protein [Methylopila turkensis]GLK81057.1 sulfate transporter subunit [Methylopila turkensis]
MKRFLAARLLAALTVVAPVAVAAPAAAQSTLTNVSYDPTRELYKDFNALFAKHWKAETGQDIRVQVSHGGSGKQARSVIDGLNADVVTLALASDIDAIAKATKKLPADWQKRLPNNSSPYTSTIVFLVRKGNPKGIKDWNDLVKPGVEVITPNPKTSGGARWNYLAAWAYGLKQNDNDPEKAKAFVAELFKHVPVLDSGARGSTTTFAQRGLGDVLLAWENEAYLSFQEFGDDKFEIVFPSISILAEPPVAIVDANVDKNGSRKAAEAYLNLLYSPEGQSLAAKHFYRPVKPETVSNKADVERFKSINLVTIDDTFGGWAKAQGEHFGDGGVFDQIFKPGN